MTTAMREIAKLTNWNNTFSKGNMTFEIRIFLIRDEESKIEVMAVVVESAMRAKSTFPKMR